MYRSRCCNFPHEGCADNLPRSELIQLLVGKCELLLGGTCSRSGAAALGRGRALLRLALAFVLAAASTTLRSAAAATPTTTARLRGGVGHDVEAKGFLELLAGDVLVVAGPVVLACATTRAGKSAAELELSR